MVKKILLFLLVVVVGFLGYVATRPSAFHIERTATMAAPAEVVFAEVNDFNRWPQWSPWEKLDPEMKRTIEGGPGSGATYHWIGNDKVGEGRMTIVESQPAELVRVKLEFLKPWTATSTSTFALAPEGDRTRVVWSMDGHNDFMAKTMSVFMNMDRMIGADFDKGLASLRTVAEGQAAAAEDSTAAATQP